MGTGPNKAAWTLAENEHVKALEAQSENLHIRARKI
jgi:hypothetical protein